MTTAQEVRPATPGQTKEVGATLLQAIPGDLEFDDAKAIIGRKSEVIEDLQKVLAKYCPPKHLLNLDLWRRVYEKLGLNADELNSLAVEAVAGHWDIYVLKGVTPNMVVEALRKIGLDVYTYVDDLDADVTKNDRDPASGSYHVRVKAEVEAKELAGKSANDLSNDKIGGTTLLESLLLWLAYYLATKKHLDAKQITLCSGSRDSDGDVPFVDWYPGRRLVYVSWCDAGHRDGRLSARAVS